MYLLWYNQEIDFFSLVKAEGDNIPPYAILSHTWGADEEELDFLDVVTAGGLYGRRTNRTGHGVDHKLVRSEDLTPSERAAAITFAKAKGAYCKALFCATQAKKDGLEYCWIDSSCIDKRSSAELSEALNSMFRWYQEAAKCYVFLSDFPTLEHDLSKIRPESWESEYQLALQNCRWFTRGWYLHLSRSYG